jgi:hypothetical protein
MRRRARSLKVQAGQFRADVVSGLVGASDYERLSFDFATVDAGALTASRVGNGAAT